MLPKARMSRVGHYANFRAGNGGERKTSLRTKAKKTDSTSLKSDKARGVVGRRRKELEVAQGREPVPQMAHPLAFQVPLPCSPPGQEDEHGGRH